MVVLLAVGTTLLCTAHLVAGFIAGRRLQPVVATVQYYHPAMMDFVRQTQATCDQAHAQQDRLPFEIATALDRLNAAAGAILKTTSESESSKALARESERPATSPSMSVVEPAPAPHALSNEEVTVLTPPATNETIPHKENRRAVRRAYPVHQYVAEGCGDAETLGRFERVLCHDLSATGISFFLDRKLDTDQPIIITLGTPDKMIFMKGVITYSRFVIQDDTESYRIGCRFLNRVEGDTKWLQELCA